MNSETMAAKRPTLSLPFCRNPSDRQLPRSPTLSGTELRRIVTDLIG